MSVVRPAGITQRRETERRDDGSRVGKSEGAAARCGEAEQVVLRFKLSKHI